MCPPPFAVRDPHPDEFVGCGDVIIIAYIQKVWLDSFNLYIGMNRRLVVLTFSPLTRINGTGGLTVNDPGEVVIRGSVDSPVPAGLLGRWARRLVGRLWGGRDGNRASSTLIYSSRIHTRETKLNQYPYT